MYVGDLLGWGIFFLWGGESYSLEVEALGGGWEVLFLWGGESHSFGVGKSNTKDDMGESAKA